MKKFILISITIVTIFSCNKDDNTAPQNPVEEIPQTEIPQIEIPEESTVYISIEIPENTTKEEYILADNKNRELPINSTGNIKAEENTIVSLIKKDTEKIIYIAYILKDDINVNANKSNSKTAVNNSTCDNPSVVGVKSTARFILASVLSPISVFHVGNSDTGSFYEIFKSNILCRTFSEQQILNVENTVKQLIEEGEDLAGVAVSSAIKTIIEPITGGLFSDCWEIATELIFNGKIELEAHPYQDYTSSLILYNSNNPAVPHVIDEFTNVLPNGVIIKDAVKLENGNWKIKFDAYNSLPIPLGVRVGKLKEGTRYQIEPANNSINHFIKSNGSSIIQMIKNGFTCEGFVNNAFDSYYTTVTEGLAVRSSDYDKREVELEFNPENQYVLFQGPNEDDSVLIYHIMESLSHIFDFIQIGEKLADVEEENIKLEIINDILSDSDILNEVNSNASNLKVLQKIIGIQMRKYIEESIEGVVSTELTGLLSKYGIEKAAVSKNLKIINTSLDIIDNINYLDAWSKIDDYTRPVKDYELYIPSDNSTNTEPVFNPTPADNATNVPLNGNLSFEKGVNTPENAKFSVFVATSSDFQNADNKIGTDTSYSYANIASNTTYYWKVETISDTGNVLATSPIWSFTTVTSSTNTEPVFNPTPTDMSTNIALDGSLSFSAGANTPTDATYRLYFDTNTSPITQYNLGNQTTYSYSNLQENTTYYWKVETIRNTGDVIATSPVYSFTTVEHAPSINCGDNTQDITPPMAICKWGITVQLDAMGSALITATDIDDGSYDNCGIFAFSLDKSTFTATDLGNNTVTLTVVDESGNSSSCTAMVTIKHQ